MRIGIVGAAGQLGTELCQRLGDQAVGWTRAELDITRSEDVARQLDRDGVGLVINTSAYNKVDQAEDEPQVAYAINAIGPRTLAVACAARDIPLVHISTDYVFGLTPQLHVPLLESDAPGPVSAYGVSKLAGEYFVRALCPRHFVVRTCGLYGHAARQGAGKGNFIETMLRLAKDRSEVRVVRDQACTPTSVSDLAQALIGLSRTSAYGLYHATNKGAANWAELAAHVFQAVGMSTRVIPIPSSEYPTKARRPAYSVLNCDKLADVLGRPLPDWRSAVATYLSERNASYS
jgi:dTDP-4-dehydrorhamnose reductase